jgi:hypothetical protein
MPDTKPDLKLDDEGICSACRSYENRKAVDWASRERELMEILARYRSQNQSGWDCIVPVSGGKDSTYQVIRMLQMGMNPLCVTATTSDLSDIGRMNNREHQSASASITSNFSPNKQVRRQAGIASA